MKRLLAALAVAALLGSGLWLLPSRTATGPETVEKLRLAVSPQIMSALIYVAADRGYFRAQGLDVTLETYRFGKDALARVLNGDGDVATVTETPLALAALKGAPATVFAVIQSTDKDVAIIARKNAGIGRPADLAGKRIGVAPGTNYEYYLDLFLALNQVDPKTVTVVPVTQDNGAEELMAGHVDALAAWITARNAILDAMPDQVTLFADDGLYTEFWTLAARPDFLQTRPEAVRRLLKALVEAERFTLAHRAEAIAIVASRLGYSPDLARRIWNDLGFGVTLNQSLLISLQGEANRLIATLPEALMPNFLDYISTEELRSIDPGRVTLSTPQTTP